MNKPFYFSLILCVVMHLGFSQPYFAEGTDPKPEETCWKKVINMSDEFNGNTLNASKWQSEPISNSWAWDGRPPVFFKASNVHLKNGRMCVTVSKLDTPNL